MGEFGIGQGVPRFEDPKLVQGQGYFIDDVVYSGMAYGVVLRSPHAYAKIVSIDTAAAKAAPGVLEVLTSADIKAAGYGDLPGNPGLKRRGGAPMHSPRYPVLADGYVRWVGDCVAFIVADTAAQAQDALELVEVEYETLEAITLLKDAIKPDAPRVHDQFEDNICFVELI